MKRETAVFFTPEIKFLNAELIAAGPREVSWVEIARRGAARRVSISKAVCASPVRVEY